MQICTKQLSYTYMPGTSLEVKALREIDLSIERGGFTVLLGPSGSGKSTLLQLLSGLLRPTAGDIFLDGRRLQYRRREMKALRRQVGLVFQEPEIQFFCETLYDEIAFAPRNFALSPEAVRPRVEQALQQVGLDDPALLQRSPFQLSAGQQRLAAIAAVLAMQPRVLFLDEPTAGLDRAGERKLFDLLQRLNRRQGLTVVVITHRLDQVASLADYYLVLGRGRLLLEGSPAELFSQAGELRRCGLSLPPVMQLMSELIAQGLPFTPVLYSVEEARQEINAWRKKVLS